MNSPDTPTSGQAEPAAPTTGDPAPTQRSTEEVLADAVRVLTEAARLTRPVLTRDEAASSAERPVWVDSGTREPADWAEFVTLALAGAAANIGSIGAALAGRPGSWEADTVRSLLASTVGKDDQEQLLRHRTEPVLVTVYVEDLMIDLGAYDGYDQAQRELSRRAEAVAPSAPSPTEAAALPPLTEEQEQQLVAVTDLEERLEQMRTQDYAEYGQAFKAAVEAAAARRGLPVPVQVVVDLESFGPSSPAGGRDYVSIADDLYEEAVNATPLPGRGRTPLDRVEHP